MVYSSLLSVLRSKSDDRERGNCLNPQKCQDETYIAPASGRELTAMKGKGWIKHFFFLKILSRYSSDPVKNTGNLLRKTQSKIKKPSD